MLVREEQSGPKIVMLDCGLVTVASPLDWSHLKDLLMAIAAGLISPLQTTLLFLVNSSITK
jgi:hypothetical protein